MATLFRKHFKNLDVRMCHIAPEHWLQLCRLQCNAGQSCLFWWSQVLAHWPDHLCGQEPPIVTARPNQSAQIQSIRPPHKSNQSQLKFSIPYQLPPGCWGCTKTKSYMLSDPPIRQDRFHKCNKCITNLSYHQIHRVKSKHQMMEHTNAL